MTKQNEVQKAPKADKNDARQAGRQASAKVLFGENSRFAAFAVHTRFESVQWFVADAERPDDLGLASVIRQEPTFDAAVRGLS